MHFNTDENGQLRKLDTCLIFISYDLLAICVDKTTLKASRRFLRLGRYLAQIGRDRFTSGFLTIISMINSLATE